MADVDVVTSFQLVSFARVVSSQSLCQVEVLKWEKSWKCVAAVKQAGSSLLQ